MSYVKPTRNSSSLLSHVNSRYFEAANKLTSNDSPRRIVAYVESYDDIYFWRTILNRFETKERYFEIMLPAQSKLSRGKKSVLKTLLSSTGSDMIACVDADYDFLLQGISPSSYEMLNTPYVFHTYAYAIENLQCYAPSLHDVCVMTTLNDRHAFNFQTFFADYSRIIYPLFVWSVWLYRHNRYDVMSITDMDHVISIGYANILHIDNLLSKLMHKVEQRVKVLRNDFPEVGEEIGALKQELRSLGVLPENCYLYVHGHFLFEKVAIPVLTNVCKLLRKEREEEIRRQSKHYLQEANELSCYTSSIQDISTMLKKSQGFLHSDECKKIFADMEKVFA